MKMPKGYREVMAVFDEKGVKHSIYGDDFVESCLMDALSKLSALEAEKAKRDGEMN